MPDPIQGVNATAALSVASPGEAGSSQAGSRAEPAGAAAPVDSADVTRAEALLATILQAGAAIPPVDEARVAELQQAISSGAYEANPQQIAQKIMEIEYLLGAKGMVE